MRSTDRRGTRIVIGLWLATMALTVGAMALVFLSLSANLGESWGFRGFAVLFAVTFGTIGALIGLRVPGNRVGVVFSAIGLASAIQEFVAGYDAYAILVAPGALPWATQLAWLQTWDWVPSAGLSTTVLLLIFPDGRLPSPRWRPALWLSGASLLLLGIIQAIVPGPIQNAPYIDNPLGLTAFGTSFDLIRGLGFAFFSSMIVVSATSLVARFRRSDGIERLQLKWVASAAVLGGFALAGPGTLFNLVTAGSPAQSGAKAAEVLTIVAILTIPIAAGIAILRYRLYDIDRIISKSVGYAFLSVVLFGAFAVVNLVLQSVLSGVTSSDSVSVAASTLAVAALFSPVRSAIQRLVDRRFHRARHDADRMASVFAVRMRDELDLRALADVLTAATRGAVEPTTISVWIRRS